jgi:hypothetical protein
VEGGIPVVVGYVGKDDRFVFYRMAVPNLW